MNRVGLVSVSIHNYGSLLQTYAMQKVLDNYGVDNEIVLFKSDPVKQIYRIFNIPFMTMKVKLLKRIITTRVFYPNIFHGAALRDRAFMDFKDNYCRFTRKITDRKELEAIGNKYKAFVLGSDQVWNPANLEMDFYTLNFVPEAKMKIAYAPSFGVTTIPNKQKEKTAAYLKRIQFISVRETAGAKIVNELTGRNVPVVCDPTALLTRKQWDEIKTPNRLIEGKYIFCYFLGANSKHREFANRVKEMTGYKIVALQHIDEFVKGDLHFGDVTPYNIGPEKFVNLIANAELVLTDSFHGTMFSIYYEKKFFTFPRYGEGKKDSTNSRIVSILNLMGIPERFLNGSENASVIREVIDWDSVQNKLDAFRNESYTYLENALKESELI